MIYMDNLLVGRTEVKVIRKEIDERTRREKISEIHKGIVVGKTNSFVRVFNNAPREKGGDISPELTELFPISSPRCWVEVSKVRDESKAFVVPLTMRN